MHIEAYYFILNLPGSPWSIASSGTALHLTLINLINLSEIEWLFT